MSGLAHPPHDFADGDDCLAADSFAPFAEGFDCAAAEGFDPTSEEMDGGEACEALEPDEYPADTEDAGAWPEVVAETCPLACEVSEDVEAAFDEEPLDAGRPDDADAEPWSEGALETELAAVAEAAGPAEAAEVRGGAPDEQFAGDEFSRDIAFAPSELRILPPPVALAPDARPVPDAAPDRRPRRRRLRAWTCGGLAVVAAEVALSFWNAPPPEILVRDVAAARGIHPDDFVRIAEIESRLDPKAYNRLSKAAGLFQLLPGTAKQYKVADSFDARANAEAAARLLKHNAARLKKALGREPTAWELYLAHQQGAGGAIKLLKNPDKKAVEVVGRLPVLWNRGTEEMTAKQFATMWRDAFDGKKKPAAVN